MTLLHRPRSGNLVRSWRCHHLQQDLRNADCILIEGSNMAECHPVGFQWVMEAKARGARVIHVDPRFMRTSALADLYVPIRAGADIAFVGGLINYVLSSEKYFKEYVLAYTNAPTILTEDYADTEDLDGVFSGLNREYRFYDFDAWRYQGAEEVKAASGERDDLEAERHRIRRLVRQAGRGEAHGSAALPPIPRRTRTTHCSIRAACCRFSNGTSPATPQNWWSRSAGCPRICSRRYAGSSPTTPAATARRVRLQPRLDTAHRWRAVHPYRRDPAGTARQHRPTRRRHHGSARPHLHSGSTDISTLFDLLPGYLPMPHAYGNEDLDTEFGTVVVQDDVCNGCGYCVSACPFGVIGRRESDGGAHKCTLCYDRLDDGLLPACAKACPTESIQFGPLDELRERAQQRVAELHDAGRPEAQLYGADPGDGIGGAGAFFLLLDQPEVYGLPPDPVVPTRDLRRVWRRAGIAAASLGVAAVAACVAGRA